MKNKHIVISLGGSLICPSVVDVQYLKDFKELVVSYVKKGFSFVIITGGGRVCREYQQALLSIIPETSSYHLDLVGIETTHLNARLVQGLFGDLASPDLFIDPATYETTSHPILVGAGHKPGASSDIDTVEVARVIRATTIINLSNISHVFNKDPKQYSDALKYHHITWGDYRDLIPKEWTPGLSSPFDPIASQQASRFGMEVIIIDGKNLREISNFLEGFPFEGTRISNSS